MKQDFFHFHVGDPSTSWRHLFESMERIKGVYSAVEDYSVSETTLEQVFLSFAKMQRGEEEKEDQEKDVNAEEERDEYSSQ